MTRLTVQTACSHSPCGKPLLITGYQLANWRKSGRAYCGPDCVREMRRAAGAARRQQIETVCAECTQLVTLTQKGKITAWRRSGRAYCSDACRDAWVDRDRSARMTRTNQAHASARMTRSNPMSKQATRDKMAATLRRIRHRPRLRGGNGTPVPEPQRRLAEYLGWPTEVIIAPGDGERPYHYKADIAHPSMKVLAEVDGASHSSQARRASDQRRDERLASLGWLTFRFSNQAATERTAECAREVLSTTSRWTPRTPT